MLADVLTPAASWHSEQPLLTYLVPDKLQKELRIGQLVAIPYGNRLVEGIVWHIDVDEDLLRLSDFEREEALRSLHAILDAEPAFLPHQIALAEWLAEYYVTPLALTAFMMLPPGLMQRSQMVLHLVRDEAAMLQTDDTQSSDADISLRLRALVGLLLEEGELDVERLKEMLGAKKAREILKEAMQSGLIEREAQLQPPKTKARIMRVVRLIASEKTLEQWRQQSEARLLQSTSQAGQINMAPDNVRRRPLAESKKKHKNAQLDTATAVLTPATLTAEEKEILIVQRQLAAVDLLQRTLTEGGNAHWTPGMLCKATEMTATQLQQLVRQHLIVIEEAEIRRDPLLGRTIAASVPLELTTDQRMAYEGILEDVDHPVLLHGVTGSGKTEVYLQALATVIAQGKRGIVLVPEIALTTQAVQRVAGRFPGRVAIIHSALSDGERYDEWRRIRAGHVDVVIGSRSALFSPLPNLGIVILDEEHEPAYKQAERRPTYNAREAAITLGHILRLIELKGRIGGSLPPVEVIDLRNELHSGNTSIISRRLQEELENVLSKGQQAILFLNRRGAASCVLCRDCGYVAICDSCDVPLTYHSTEHLLLCHYCGSIRKAIQFCPNCNSSGIRYFGLGTEKVQATIKRSFPSARLLRWDRDTARNRQAHEQLLDRFANREADILIGTQMIAKGLDLPGVTLVGVVSADIALNMPDFAASERAFTLLTQVAGRAGRGKEAGQVIIQTFNPQHFCIDAASRHDYHEFYAAEIETRQRYSYPPFRRFVKFTYRAHTWQISLADYCAWP